MKTKIENGIEYELKNGIWCPKMKSKNDGIKLGKYGLLEVKNAEKRLNFSRN